jgi:GPI inositol-deacylase
MKSRSSGSTDDGDGHPFESDLLAADTSSDGENLVTTTRTTLTTRPSSARSRRTTNTNWRHELGRNGSIDKKSLDASPLSVLPAAVSLSQPPPDSVSVPTSSTSLLTSTTSKIEEMAGDQTVDNSLGPSRRTQLRGPWVASLLVLLTTMIGISTLCSILNSLVTRQLDAKGCRMSYMRPSYIRFGDFDTEHTRFATKYSLYLYREQGIDDSKKVIIHL